MGKVLGMNNDKQEKENLIAISSESEIKSHDFLPNTALGQYRFLIVIFLLILFMAIVFVVLRFLGFYDLEKEISGEHENPIFSTAEESDIPEVAGMKVYDIRTDIPEIEKDASKENKEFYKHIDTLDKNEKHIDAVRMIKQRDRLAAEKLELLKKIEGAKSKEERQNLIRQLEGTAPQK
jgi:hypothetical protein